MRRSSYKKKLKCTRLTDNLKETTPDLKNQDKTLISFQRNTNIHIVPKLSTLKNQTITKASTPETMAKH